MRGTTMRGPAIGNAESPFRKLLNPAVIMAYIIGVSPVWRRPEIAKPTACLPMERIQLGKTHGDKTAATHSIA